MVKKIKQLLVVGIGQTGLEAIKELKGGERLHPEIEYRYLYIDSESVPSDADYIEHKALVKEARDLGLHRDELNNWIPKGLDTDYFSRIKSRLLDRINLFWDFKSVSQCVYQAIRDMGDRWRRQDIIDEVLDIVLIANLGDRFSSSIIIDIGYLIRATALKERKIQSISFLVIPNAKKDGNAQCAYGYAALKELEYFNQMRTFSARYRLGNVKVEETPFHLSYLILKEFESNEELASKIANQVLYRTKEKFETNNINTQFNSHQLKSHRATDYALMNLTVTDLPWNKYISVQAHELALKLIKKAFFETAAIPNQKPSPDFTKELLGTFMLPEDFVTKLDVPGRDRIFAEFAERVRLKWPLNETRQSLNGYINQVIRQTRIQIDNQNEKTTLAYKLRIREHIENVIQNSIINLADIGGVLDKAIRTFSDKSNEYKKHLSKVQESVAESEKKLNVLLECKIPAINDYMRWVPHPRFQKELLHAFGERLAVYYQLETVQSMLVMYEQLMRILTVEKEHYENYFSMITAIHDHFGQEASLQKKKAEEDPGYVFGAFNLDKLFTPQIAGSLEDRCLMVKKQLGVYYQLEIYDNLRYIQNIYEDLWEEIKKSWDRVLPFIVLRWDKLKKAFSLTRYSETGTQLGFVKANEKLIPKLRDIIDGSISAEFIEHGDIGVISVGFVEYNFPLFQIKQIVDLKPAYDTFDPLIPLHGNAQWVPLMRGLTPDIMDSAILLFATALALDKIVKAKNLPVWVYRRGDGRDELGAYLDEAYRRFVQNRQFCEEINLQKEAMLADPEQKIILNKKLMTLVDQLTVRIKLKDGIPPSSLEPLITTKKVLEEYLTANPL